MRSKSAAPATSSGEPSRFIGTASASFLRENRYACSPADREFADADRMAALQGVGRFTWVTVFGSAGPSLNGPSPESPYCSFAAMANHRLVACAIAIFARVRWITSVTPWGVSSLANAIAACRMSTCIYRTFRAFGEVPGRTNGYVASTFGKHHCD